MGGPGGLFCVEVVGNTAIGSTIDAFTLLGDGITVSLSTKQGPEADGALLA